MPDEYRVTIRLSQELYAQLAARSSQGQPLAAIVCDALADYLARQPETPPSPETLAVTVAAMAARLDGLQDQIEALAARVDTRAASGRPPAAHKPTRPPSGQRKLSATQRRELHRKRARGIPIKALMEEYGFSRATLYRYLQEGAPAPALRPARNPGTMRARILTLLRAHPAGLSAEEIRVYLPPAKPLGDVLLGMRRQHVVHTRGSGQHTRYYLP
jgi:hypothetical protein